MRTNIAVLGLAVLLAAPSRAGDDREYLRLLEKAAAQERDRQLRDVEDRLNAAHDTLVEAARLCPARWEAFYELGVNRAKRAFWMHGEARDHITFARARGAPLGDLKAKEAGAARMIETMLSVANARFDHAFKLQRRLTGDTDRQKEALATMYLKFAAKEYERARRGQPGAIADLQKLMRAGFNEDFCRNHIALCYLDLGEAAHSRQDYPRAQALWDKGLRWAKARWLRRMLYTNKAGAYELDNEFDLAEKLLLQQVADEPTNPVHHKNLGLVAGFQNRLREAAYYYGKARELCARDRSGRLPFFHGNAWLRAAEVHGHLLPEDGDVLLAWRLFLEYRARHGDDYNFAVAFGRFANANGRYELAWRYYQHAAALQPHCTVPFQALAQIAPRVGKDREEADRLSEETGANLKKVQARYEGSDEPHHVARVCAGLRDDPRMQVRGASRPIDGDDPFAGSGPAAPPAWVKAIAEQRSPFTPWVPANDGGAQPEGTDGEATSVSTRVIFGTRFFVLAGAAVLAVAAVGLGFGRRATA